MAAPLWAIATGFPPPFQWLVPACMAVVSLITGLAYRSDKRRAQAGEWRIPESTLHFLDLLGGWPGGFLAQRWCRHKTAKASFQAVFWLTVAIHQFIAVDSLLHWKVLSQLGPLLEKALHASGR